MPWWVVQGVIRIVDDAGGGERPTGSRSRSASGDRGAGTTSTPYYLVDDLTAMIRLLKLVRMLHHLPPLRVLGARAHLFPDHPRESRLISASPSAS